MKISSAETIVFLGKFYSCKIFSQENIVFLKNFYSENMNFSEEGLRLLGIFLLTQLNVQVIR